MAQWAHKGGVVNFEILKNKTIHNNHAQLFSKMTNSPRER